MICSTVGHCSAGTDRERADIVAPAGKPIGWFEKMNRPRSDWRQLATVAMVSVTAFKRSLMRLNSALFSM